MAHVSFTGNTTGGGELRFMPDGKAVLNLNVAENHSRKNKQTNEWEESGVTFRRVALFGKKAEHLAEQVGKGSLVHVSGREETRAYTTKDGQQGTSLEVIAEDVGVIYAKNATGGGYQAAPQTRQQGGYPQQGQQSQRPQQGQADPWGQQGGGNYAWGNQPQEDTPPF